MPLEIFLLLLSSVCEEIIFLGENFVLPYCTSPTMQIGEHTCRAELIHVYYAAVAGRLTQPSHHAELAHGCRLFRSFALWPLASEGKWSLRFRHPSCGKLVRV